MQRAIPPKSQARLRRRPLQPVDPERAIAIKRDVHEFEVDVDARTFADAFRAVLIDATGRFGLIRVKRPAERLGLDFEVGERFQGCFSLERALLGRLEGRAPRALAGLVESVFQLPWAERLVAWLEDRLLSDYAEVQHIEMEPDLGRGECFQVSYAYLRGTPIAGTTTFTVEPLDESRCRVRQVLEYQEVSGVALGAFQRFGLKLHDQVVYEQVAQAAARAGAGPVRGTIPTRYARA